MPLDLQIIAQPFEINFSGNPIPYTLGLSPYGTIERTQDIRILVRVQQEAGLNTNIFSDVRSTVLYPDVLGKAEIDIRSIADAYVEYQTPRLTLSRPIRADKQRRRFRISVSLQQNGMLIGTPVISDIIHVIKGGLAYEQFHFSEFFTNTIATQLKPLHYFTGKELTAAAEYKFLYWVYPLVGVSIAQTVEIVLTMDDASTVTYVLPDTIIPSQWGVFMCPAGFNQLNLAAQVPVGRTCVSYTVSVYVIPVAGPNIIVVDPVKFILDYRNFYDSAVLLYTNSVGGMDTIRILGDIDASADYNTNNAERVVPPSGIADAILQPQVISANNDETEKFNGNTEFISRDKINRLRDLLLSRNVYEIKNDKLIPVVVNKKNVKLYTTKEGLTGMAIEWQNAFSNAFYTPAGALPAGRTCPAMLNLVAKQISKNKLQILWSLPMPYDIAELDIYNGTTHQPVSLIGNSGSQYVNFTNTAIWPATLTLTIKGRVICDPWSNPVDSGPWTTITITVDADTLPIANDDTYTIAAGFTSPQSFVQSVLVNDYDPDGDAIRVQAVTGGATAAGGTYDIDAAGIVTYTPPTAIYNGIDNFLYTIEQISNTALTASALCYIKVGDTTIGNNTFASIGFENQYMYQGNGDTHVGGEIFVYYYSDPLGTVPKDVTALGLTINLQQIFDELVSGSMVSTTTTPSFAASGTKNIVWSLSDYIYYYEDAFNVLQVYWAYTFSLQAGSGYVII